MGVGLRDCMRRGADESLIYGLSNAIGSACILAWTVKPTFMNIAASVKVGSLQTLVARRFKVDGAGQTCRLDGQDQRLLFNFQNTVR